MLLEINGKKLTSLIMLVLGHLEAISPKSDMLTYI